MIGIEMTELDAQAEYIEYLVQRKFVSRDKSRKSTSEERAAQLVIMQDQIYRTLAFRNDRFGKPIPEKWQKWYKARRGYADSIVSSS